MPFRNVYELKKQLVEVWIDLEHNTINTIKNGEGVCVPVFAKKTIF